MIGALLKVVGARALGWTMAGLGVVIAFITAYQRGRTAAKQEVATSTAAANERMLDAATNAPKERTDVAADLRTCKF